MGFALLLLLFSTASQAEVVKLLCGPHVTYIIDTAGGTYTKTFEGVGKREYGTGRVVVSNSRYQIYDPKYKKQLVGSVTMEWDEYIDRLTGQYYNYSQLTNSDGAVVRKLFSKMLCRKGQAPKPKF